MPRSPRDRADAAVGTPPPLAPRRHRKFPGLAALVALAPAAAPATLLLPVHAAAAQQAPVGQGAIGGTVLAGGTNRPLADAQVSVEGTTLGANTDANGRFRVGGLSGTEVRVTVRRIGYVPTTLTARVGQTELRVVMSERAVELGQVVVTGTAGLAEKRAIGNVVTTVNAAEIAATQPIRNFQDLLTGRAAGVSIVGSSGQVGTGSRIRVRGASSLSLNNDPLIYVDGVRVDNTQASGPTNQAFGSRSVSRWNDFDPDDIESLEVIKGPAAATLYGTEASNGVIQIITKKGAAGKPTWNFTGRVGANWIPDWENRFFTNYGIVQNPDGSRDTTTINVGQLNQSLNSSFGNDIFRTGALADAQLSVSGGTSAFTYFVGGNYEKTTGVERVNKLDRTNFRVNVTANPSPAWTLQASTGYTTGSTYLPYESGGGGATWATYFSSPCFRYSATVPNSGGVCTGPDTNPQLGFRSGPPNIYYQAYNIFQDADRFTGSVTISNRPAKWLDHRLILGTDRLIEDNQTQAPRNDPLAQQYAAFSDVGGTTRGALTVNTRSATNVTFDYAANGTFDISPSWRSITSAGGQFYGRRTVQRESYGEQFPASGLTALNAATVQRLVTDEPIENNTLGGFVQEQLIFGDRLFLTGAVRRDDNSAFGTDYPAVTYPKFSASYVMSEEAALPLPEAINTLRLRGAYGGSGLQPGAFDAIRTYQAAGGFLTPQFTGNPDLGPETSYELELGFDLGMFDDRYGVDFTYFNGTTEDAILSRQAPPSAGFPGLQFFNAGQVDRRGFEWILRAQPVRRENLVLDFALNGSTNKYEIQSLGDGTEVVDVSSTNQHRVGYAPGAWFDRKVVSGTYDPVTKTVPNSTLQCDDGNGGTTPCYSGSTLVAPRVFLGNSVPTREGSLSASATLWKNFRVNAFFDYRGGYSKLDGNRRVRCNLFFLCRENYYPDEFDAVTLAEAQRGTAFTYNLIQDASFTRFRELSLTYTLPLDLSRRVGASRATITVAGRNLGLWTKYDGVEPEASFNSGTRGASFGQWEQNVLPQTRQFVTTLNLSF